MSKSNLMKLYKEATGQTTQEIAVRFDISSSYVNKMLYDKQPISEDVKTKIKSHMAAFVPKIKKQVQQIYKSL